MTQKRTFRLQINRTNTTTEPNAGVYMPLLNSERFIIEFQCDAGTMPTVTALMELQETDKLKAIA